MNAAKKLACLWLLLAMTRAADAATGIEPAPIPDVDEVYPSAPDWAGLRVLHIGDSHVSRGFEARLRALVRGAGGSYVAAMWVGSRSKSWVTSGRLRALIEEHAPNVVIVTLGTNSMTWRRPRLQAPWIESLVRQIGPRRCFWTGPPSILEDAHGFNEVAAAACAPCRYFDTRELGFPPRSDGKFHLTWEQGELWATRVWSFMNGAGDAL